MIFILHLKIKTITINFPVSVCCGAEMLKFAATANLWSTADPWNNESLSRRGALTQGFSQQSALQPDQPAELQTPSSL